ncbi:MAG TPA: phosphoserine phosphatase SerB [Usitatibacteraceae bacterium]|nr:phosphoserine phosphatase SerB [Usitatibacteraceae bacterium]
MSADRQDLVIQGNDLPADALRSVQTIAGSTAAVQVAGPVPAWRLSDANPAARSEVAAFCDRRSLDHAFVPAGREWNDIGLIAMDMDSTLITIECIDEIADFAGRKAEVAAVTAAAMRGEIDWPQSLRQRVSLLEGLDEAVLAAVYEQRLALTPGAEALIAFARAHGIRLLLVSGGFTFFTDRIRQRLGLDFAYSNLLGIRAGRLTGQVDGPLCDAHAKRRHLMETRDALGLAPQHTLAIGDGANDLPMMAEAGYSIAYRAKPKVQAAASAAINHGGLDRVLALFPGGV